MKNYPLTIHCDHPEVHFEHNTAARLARVSEKLIRQCEREELITSHIMLHGRKGLCCADVCKLKIIRHLHQDLGLDLEAVDFILRYRNRIRTMQCRLEAMQQRMRQKELAHRDEILALRRQVGMVSDMD